MNEARIRLFVLQEIADLLEGSERCFSYPDDLNDPTRLTTEWDLDTKVFRAKIQKRISELREAINHDGKTD